VHGVASTWTLTRSCRRSGRPAIPTTVFTTPRRTPMSYAIRGICRPTDLHEQQDENREARRWNDAGGIRNGGTNGRSRSMRLRNGRTRAGEEEVDATAYQKFEKFPGGTSPTILRWRRHQRFLRRLPRPSTGALAPDCQGPR
jgi:hypothetical protein